MSTLQEMAIDDLEEQVEQLQGKLAELETLLTAKLEFHCSKCRTPLSLNRDHEGWHGPVWSIHHQAVADAMEGIEEEQAALPDDGNAMTDVQTLGSIMRRSGTVQTLERILGGVEHGGDASR